ncbi:MAG: YvcK family protein [Chloroflexi bacterium]|nr:YvcK family protein [Chloroflexota bacterium]
MGQRPKGTDSEKRVVVIGGGTGSYAVLRGLKQYTSGLTAVVTMMDSGGSSGRLRDELGLLPPGDLRQCLVALSPDGQTTLTLRNLFLYRFDRGKGLNGHSFGNLFLSALMEVSGDVNQAVKIAGRMLGIKGQVLPVTLTDCHLCARLADGSVIVGESHIDVRTEKPQVPIESVFLDPQAEANLPVLEALAQADAIVIGPGDLYSSVIPNLLVRGIPEAIKASPAVKIYVCNLMTKAGETDGFTASMFVQEIMRYLGPGASLDYAVVNTGSFPAALLKRYAEEGALPVHPDLDACAELVSRVSTGDVMASGSLLRHDPAKLAGLVMDLVGRQPATLVGAGPRPALSSSAR